MSSKRKPFFIRELRGVKPEIVEKLRVIGIKNSEQMLLAGQTVEKRTALADKAGIPPEDVLELVKLSDLARLPGVKGIRARLYYDAGINNVEKMAEWEPEALRIMVAKYVEQTGFDGLAPLPKEVSSTIANARQLPKVVKW